MNDYLSPIEKAQQINLDEKRYGTFVEIGAGQEVVRSFFQASGSAGTVAKSMSAYDMTVSDDIYGTATRYVCRERVDAMLERESQLTLQRLDKDKGDNRCFFSYANTVSARNYHGTNRCHGWMGIDYQSSVKGSFNRVVVHFNLSDQTNILQQEAVGVLGVNLIHSAFYHHEDKMLFLKKLFEGLNKNRIEVDFIDFSGPNFSKVNNQLISLCLVRMELSSLCNVWL